MLAPARLLCWFFVSLLPACSGQVSSAPEGTATPPTDASAVDRLQVDAPLEQGSGDATSLDVFADAPLDAADLPDVMQEGCTFEGKSIDPLDTFQGPDGCQCLCLPGGTMTCSGLTCDSDAGSSACDYYGTTYPLGETWDCSDGCNTCFCSNPGELATTTIGCMLGGVCQTDSGPVEQGRHVLAPDGCNLCTCWGDGALSCTTTWFCLDP